jgi:hypothetical protein
MIYHLPTKEEAIDQGDLIEGCPLTSLASFDLDQPAAAKVEHVFRRIVVLTQTCDLANVKATRAIGAVVFNAPDLITEGLLKPADIRGPIRAARVWGWYFLPKSTELGLPEMIVDLRHLHTIHLDLLKALCQRGQRRARVQPLYREHLAKHFADTYSRIGLPQPYETET